MHEAALIILEDKQIICHGGNLPHYLVRLFHKGGCELAGLGKKLRFAG